MDSTVPPSQVTESELASQPGEGGEGEETPLPKPPPMPAFPPYPPYAMPPAPPSVADTIIAGRDLRLKHKSVRRKPAIPPPAPAQPRGPKATDVKLSPRAMKAYERCLRRNGKMLTDRLDRMSKPQRRKIIYLWREYAHMFPAETVARLRAMLDADEPFKPDQAYEYFINLKRGKKKNANARVNDIKKHILSMYDQKRFVWARNATVAFARGIRERLASPAAFSLSARMLRLSNIILDDLCSYMHMKTPSRSNTHPKAKFMMEISNKVAAWIDQVLAESDERMLMMDFDEDDDILGPGAGGDGNFTDDFLDMMGGGGGGPRKLMGPQPTYLKFKGPMLEAFNVLTESMYNKGKEPLLSHGQFQQTFAEAADELKLTPDLSSTDYNATLAADINKKLTEASKPNTPSELEPYMIDIIDICSKHLSQTAENNKMKGPAFKLLLDTMKKKPDDELFQKDKIRKTYGQAARELEKAKGFETDHEDSDLAEGIRTKLKNLMEEVTPSSLKKDMDDAMDFASKYLSEKATDEVERGNAFDILMKELERDGAETFYKSPSLATQFAAAHTLKTAPGLTSIEPDPTTAPIFSELLHNVVDAATPVPLKQEMDDVIERCANYLSGFDRDREIVTKKLLEMLKSKPKVAFASRPTYSMDYATAAQEIEDAPSILPYHPVKDIANEGKKNLTRDMEGLTPPHLLGAMKGLINDVAKHLSQPFALKSGIAGPRYRLEFLAAIKKSLGKKPLYKYKGYGQTYADAASTLRLGPLETTARPSAMDLRDTIDTEIQKDVPVKLAPTIAQELRPTMDTAAKHLANVGTAKGQTLEHLVEKMKEKGEVPLAQLQGYEQTYDDGARRLEDAPGLKRSQVDLGAYQEVKKKLDKMAEAHPDLLLEKHAEHLTDVIEESSKYLSAPVPDTHAEKREVLADIMGRAGHKIVAEDKGYKMTHKEGGQEIKKAKVGVTKAKDEGKKQEIQEKVEAVIPDKKMQMLLKDNIQEGAAHLADTVQGIGEALEVVKESLKKEKDKDLIAVGELKKTHEEGADMLAKAPHFEVKEPPPVLKEIIKKKVEEAVPETAPAHVQKKHMDAAKEIASKYIAAAATDESGVDPKEIAAAFGTRKRPGETEEEYLVRLAKEELEKRPGETDEEYKARLDKISKRRPGETDEQYKARLAKEYLEKRPGETDEEYKARLAQLKSKGRPGETDEEYLVRLAKEELEKRPGETDEEYKARLDKISKRRPGETDEQYKARLAKEYLQKRPGETEEEYKARLANMKSKRRPGETDEEYLVRLAKEELKKKPGETDEEYKARLDKISKRRPGETDEQYKARLAKEYLEKRPGETDEEYKARLAQLKSKGRPGETEEEYLVRLAKEELEKRPGETDEEYKARLDKISKRRPGETDEQYKARLAKEYLQKRPGETEEEYKARLANMKSKRRPGETDEEYLVRLAKEEMEKRPGETDEEYKVRLDKISKRRPGETDEQYKARLAKEYLEKRPGETDEEYKARLAQLKSKGRPGETDEEYLVRLAKEELEKRPGETDEEYKARLDKISKRRPGETDEQYKARLAKEYLQKRPGETDKEYKARLAKLKSKRRPGETEEEYKARLEEEKLRAQTETKKQEDASKLIVEQLRSFGDETFHEQPFSSLTYKEAAESLATPRIDVDEHAKASSHKARLQKKFEKKLNAVMAPVTPPKLADAMQDAVIDSAKQLSEKIAARDLKTHAGVALISEMQKKGDETLVEVDGNKESNFYAAQRLKRAKELKVDEPRTDVALRIYKKMDEVMQHHVAPPNVNPTIEEHTKVAANYLAPKVTQPDEHIEAYVTLLEEMEATGDKPLVEGDIPQTHEQAAAYLRQLTSFEDKIKRPNATINNEIKQKLKNLMAVVPPAGYTTTVMDDVIAESAGLLTSYAMSQGDKTEALKEVVKNMDEAGKKLLLRHGNVRKSYKDAANVLRDKTTPQLIVKDVDPVVERKVEIKLQNLMQNVTPPKYRPVMHGVIENATKYLAVHLLEPQVIKICKCMKSEFVQCELWCDEMLRAIATPSCTCKRGIPDPENTQSSTFLKICPGTSRVFGPDLEIAVTPCAHKQDSSENVKCPASEPTDGCNDHSTASYMLHSTVYNRNLYDSDEYPTRIPPQSSLPPSDMSAYSSIRLTTPDITDENRGAIVRNLIRDLHLQNDQFFDPPEQDESTYSFQSMSSFPDICRSRSMIRRRSSLLRQDPSSTLTDIVMQEDVYRTPLSSSLDMVMSQTRFAKSKKTDSSSNTSIVTVSTDQMGDWHAMVVSLMWNVQAWRRWIQENIDRGLAYEYDPHSTPEKIEHSWTSFHKKVSEEAVQWRQYNIFSRELTLRLLSRYSNKVILSPTRVNVKTDTYDDIARNMMRIIDMFARWTQWFILVIKECGLIQQTPDDLVPLHARCWEHYKKNVTEYLGDWNKYNMYLNVYWEQKYQAFMADCVPNLSEPGPLWVVSASGAVPSGAITAGVYEKEVIWIARTTHRCKVLPAALHPSKHCCLVYADGAVYYYTKYQVMCNADVKWVPWRGGTAGARAIRVAEGVYIGRIHYRGSHLLGPVYAPQFSCHVVIQGQPFAFNCYDLLVLAPTPSGDQRSVD